MSMILLRFLFLYIPFIFSENVIDSSNDPKEEQIQTVPSILTPESFNFVTYKDVDPDNLKENYSDHFSLINTGSTFSYEINSAFKCSEVKYKDTLMWIYLPKESQNGFPKKIVVDSHLFLVFLFFADLVKLYKCDESLCKFISQKQSLFNPTSLSLYKSESGSLVELDSSNFLSNHGFEIHYKLHDTSSFPDSSDFIKCTQIKYATHTLWNYGSDEPGNKYPNKVIFNSFIDSIIVEFDTFYMIYKYDGKHFHALSTESLNGTTPDDFKLIGENDLEINKTDYETVNYPHDNAFAYKFNEKKIIQLRFKDKLVWNYQNQEVPKLLYINIPKRKVMVQTQTLLLVYMYTDSWTLIFEGKTLDKIHDDEYNPQESEYEVDKDGLKDKYVLRLGKKPFRIMEFSSKTKTILVMVGIFLLFLITVCLIIFIK
ncbi:uncharacterized protein TA16005 [Theileria annulata]|uniref:SfiI-subtelomeric related protein family member n=1 Tax=Theileria annulata TaxID=5874 RepID=Q4UFT0_THEAN|nr:uncharacterized protein TA16005 [Theileria annulata]CAI74036.1 hypothetical protein TA16005 [Theileria annulata]|eukprot:XP_951768.1 hypothetical protein TA16005 [Theileria annulata]